MKGPDESRILELALIKGLLTREKLDEIEREASRSETLAGQPNKEGSILYLLIKHGILTPDNITSLVDELKSPELIQTTFDRVSTPEKGERQSSDSKKRNQGASKRYKILNLLGEGGMGQVYKAQDLELNRYVALKFIWGEDPEFLARFGVEARAQARVDHDNVCKVYDVGEIDGRQYIAMQYIDGETLLDAYPGMSLKEKVEVMRVVAQAVDSAHELGLIHRDLNPKNIMVEYQGKGSWKPYITDFGLARDIAMPGRTVTGSILGTPYYMPPEQADGDVRSLDGRADVYSLGATLYHLLTGRPPFDGTAIEVLKQIGESDPIQPGQLEKGIPADLDAIVMKCLEKERDRRYGSAGELAEDLERFLEGDTILARPVTWTYRMIKRAKRQRQMTALIMIIILLSIGFTGYYLYSRWSQHRQTLIRSEFDQDIRYIEDLLRHAYTSPLHDVSPTEKRVEELLGSVEEKMRLRGRLARGPGHYALGKGLHDLGRDREAKEHLETAWENGYQLPEVAYAMGAVLIGLYDREVDQLDRLWDMELRREKIKELDVKLKEPALMFLKSSGIPQVESPEYVEALLSKMKGDYEIALGKLDEALARLPWFYEAEKMKGDIYAQMAREAQDEGKYDISWDLSTEAGVFYARALAAGKSDSDVYEAECGRYVQMIDLEFERGGDPEPLIQPGHKACDKAMIADPGNYFAMIKKANLYMHEADQCFYSGEDPFAPLDQAQEIVQAVIDSNPGEATAITDLGMIYFYRAEFTRVLGEDPEKDLMHALDQFRRGLEINPSSSINHNNMGVMYKKLGDLFLSRNQDPRKPLKKAIDHYLKAIKIDEITATAFACNNLGRAYDTIARFEKSRGISPLETYTKAIDYYQRSLDKNSSSPFIHNNLANVYWGVAEYMLSTGQNPVEYYDLADDSYQRSYELNADYVYALGNRGNTCVRRAYYLILKSEDPSIDLDRAEELLSMAVEKQANYANAYRHLAMAHAYRGLNEMLEGRDPADALKRALTSLEKAQSYKKNGYLEEAGEIERLKAQWAIQQHKEPTRYLERAHALFERTLSHSPESATGLLALGKVLRLKVEWLEKRGGDTSSLVKDALAHLDKVLERNPHEAEALAEKSCLRVIQARRIKDPVEREKALKEAKSDLDNAMEMNANLKRLYME